MDKMTKQEAGRLGGQAWTLAKSNASRINGASPVKPGNRPRGRERIRPIGEVLLRRKMQPGDVGVLRSVFFKKLTPQEQGTFKTRFAVWLPEHAGGGYVDFYTVVYRTAKLTPTIKKFIRLAKAQLRRRK